MTTRVRWLPDTLASALRAARPKRSDGAHGESPAIALRSPLRPGLLLIGAAVSALGAFATYMNHRGLPDDGEVITITAALALAITLVLLALSWATRWLAPVSFRAVLVRPEWVLCMRGEGDRVDAIPLALVERIVPAEGKLDVVLREGGTRSYPYQFAIADRAFFDVARTAVVDAPRPSEITARALREVRPRSIVVPFVIAACLGLVIAASTTVYFASQLVLDRYASDTAYLEQNLAEARTQPEGMLRRGAVRATHEAFVSTYGPAMDEHGLAYVVLSRWTDFDQRLPAERASLDEAVQDEGDADTEQALAEIERFRAAPRYLRDLAADHPGTVVEERALAAIPAALAEVRARRVREGATPEMLALCDAVATSTEGFDVLVAVDDTAVRSPTIDPTSVYAYAAVAVAVAAIPAGLHEGVSEWFEGAFGRTLYPRDPSAPGLVVTTRVTVTYGTTRYVYSTVRLGSGEATSADAYPALAIEGIAHFEDTRTTPPIVFEVPVSNATPDELPMAAEHMAERYPTADSLYQELGAGLGRGVGVAIARTLCLE